MFTRQHFIAAAHTVSLMANPAERARTARELCRTFSASNPRFDRARFLSACEAVKTPTARRSTN